MSGAWSKGTTKAVATAPPSGFIQGSGGSGSGSGSGRSGGGDSRRFGSSTSRGRGSGGRHNHNSSNSSSNNSNNYPTNGRGGRGRGGSGGGGGGGRNIHRGGSTGAGAVVGGGWGRGRGGDRDNPNGHHQHAPTDRITINDVKLLNETGLGDLPSQQKVIRIDAREFLRQRLRYVDPAANFRPHLQCHWTDFDRIDIIQSLCNRGMRLGDVSKTIPDTTTGIRPPKIDTAPALEDCKPLDINEEKRWKSKVMARKSTSVEEASNPTPPETTEEIVSKALLILNKVSWTTLEKLTAQFMEMTDLVHKEDVRQRIIELLVEKAQSEPHFGPMYAQICSIIAKQVRTFKKELLAVCQKEFEIDVDHQIENATKDLQDPDQIEYQSLIIRKAYMGHMKFLGELYLRDVVKLSIMMYCLEELLKDKQHEDSLECFAHLMTTMGEKLDAHSAQNNKAFDWNQVVELRQSTTLPIRIKFLLQDLLELRERGWIRRRKEETAKTIADIHKDVAKEEQAARDASRRGSSSSNVGTSSLRRSSSLASAANALPPQVDGEGFVSISRSSFKNIHSNSGSGAGAGGGPSSVVPKPGQSSLRRAVSQPGISNSHTTGPNVPPESPFDRKKIANRFGAGGGDGTAPPPPMPSMAETSVAPSAAASVASTASPEMCAKKIQSILKEYYISGDTDDAVLSVDELVQLKLEEGAMDRGAKVIEGATFMAMEGKPQDVAKILTVMKQCVERGIIPTSSIIPGWRDPLEFLEDIEIDAPLARKHLAMIVATCLQLQVLPFDFFVTASPEYFRTGGQAAKFACQVLQERGGGPTDSIAPSDEELAVIEQLMTEKEKTEFKTGKALWDATVLSS